MLSDDILARAKGEVKAEVASDKTPSVQCEITENDENYFIAIPKRIPLTHLSACKPPMDSKGNPKPVNKVFAKLQFGDVVVTGYGKDKKGNDTEVEFPSPSINNVCLFLQIK